MGTVNQYIVMRLRSLYGKTFHPKDIFFTDYSEKSRDKIQQIIYDKIIEGKPLMVARMGSIELDVCENIKRCFFSKSSNIAFIRHKGQPNFLNPFLLPLFHKNAGFFPEDNVGMLIKFYELMLTCMKEVDVLGSWRPNEIMFKNELKNSIKVDRERMTPLLTERPWSKALRGKKVLVIHPFAKTIESQYKNREFLFPGNPDILPEFHLMTLNAVQTAGGATSNFANWFKALEYMEHEIDKIDYDVVLIGCGAYGFPLAAHCKRMGKQAIHLGGVLQLLFGIKGKRWETDPGYIKDFPYASTYYNEYWRRASKEETPQRADVVEDGCYW